MFSKIKVGDYVAIVDSDGNETKEVVIRVRRQSFATDCGVEFSKKDGRALGKPTGKPKCIKILI